MLHNKANRFVQFSANHHWICLKRPLGLTWEKSFPSIIFPTRFSGGSHPSHKVDDARDPIPSKFHQNRCSRLGAAQLAPISGPESETPPQTRQSQFVFQYFSTTFGYWSGRLKHDWTEGCWEIDALFSCGMFHTDDSMKIGDINKIAKRHMLYIWPEKGVFAYTYTWKS